MMRLFINDAFVPRDKKTLLIQLIKNFQTPRCPKLLKLQNVFDCPQNKGKKSVKILSSLALTDLKLPTELLKMVHVLRNDLQSRDGTTPEMLVTLESIERQYVKEVQAKKNLQPKITSFFKQNNNQNYVNNN